jgi:hypothetical protein
VRAISSVLLNDGRKEGSRSYGYRERKKELTYTKSGWVNKRVLSFFFLKGPFFVLFNLLSTSVFFIFIMAVIMAKLWGTHVLFIVTY